MWGKAMRQIWSAGAEGVCLRAALPNAHLDGVVHTRRCFARY